MNDLRNVLDRTSLYYAAYASSNIGAWENLESNFRINLLNDLHCQRGTLGWLHYHSISREIETELLEVIGYDRVRIN